MKRTYQPKNRKRAKTHGFRARIKTKAGKRVLKNRKRKGRVKLTVSETMKIKKPKLKPNK